MCNFVLLDRSKCVLCGQCVNACLCDANVFVGEEKETSEIFSKVMEDRIFYKNGGGMTLSGGEPALQGDASLELLSLSEKADISRAVETSGYGDSAFFTDANRLGALFLYDLKGIDDAKHLAHTGVSNRLVLENFEKLCSLSAEIIPRIPLIPGMNDTEKDLCLLKDFLLSHAGCFSRVEIMKYHILGIGKASSLGIGYEAPKESATEEDTARWLSALSSVKWETVLS
ncbi:MAG: radical SAM protein [Clostridia bacterium]|nr:radical SAM protein [Clostridia bacterium]